MALPQGSVMGPVLFHILVSDFFEDLLLEYDALFADDKLSDAFASTYRELPGSDIVDIKVDFTEEPMFRDEGMRLKTLEPD